MQKIYTKRVGYTLLFLLLFTSCGIRGQDAGNRPDTWAQPVTNRDVKNWFKLNEHVYRSAQPDSEGMEQIYNFGIRHVLNLRRYFSDEDEAKGLGLTLYRVKMNVSQIKDNEIIRALRIIKSVDDPILIHCMLGSDRTGVVSAMYRIVFQNWSKEEAIDELVNGGYGFHHFLHNIPEYIINMDIEYIKEAVNKT